MPPDLISRVREYLLRRAAPATSRDLARRFLRVESKSEESLRALLEPLLEGGGLSCSPGGGWSVEQEPATGLERQSASSEPRQVACAVEQKDGRIRSLCLVVIGHSRGDGREARRIDRVRWRQISRLLSGAEAVFIDPRKESPILLAGLARRGLPGPARIRSLARSAVGIIRIPRGSGPERIAGLLGCGYLEEGTPAAAAENVAACVEAARLARRPVRGDSRESGGDAGGDAGAEGLLSGEFLHEVPARPGVYRFYDGDGRLIYVGKAANLRRRLSSYAGVSRAGGRGRRRKVIQELHRVRRVEYLETGSDLEALLKETELIGSRRPRTNVQRRVHERGRVYSPGRAYAFVLPSPEGRGAGVVFMRDGIFEGWCRVGPRGGGMARALTILRRLLARRPSGRGPAGGPRSGRDAGDGPEIRTQILNSWLARYGDRISRLDLDSCRGPVDASRRLRQVVRDLAAGGNDVIHQR
jgi:hypothetical protein